MNAVQQINAGIIRIPFQRKKSWFRRSFLAFDRDSGTFSVRSIPRRPALVSADALLAITRNAAWIAIAAGLAAMVPLTWKVVSPVLSSIPAKLDWKIAITLDTDRSQTRQAPAKQSDNAPTPVPSPLRSALPPPPQVDLPTAVPVPTPVEPKPAEKVDLLPRTASQSAQPSPKSPSITLLHEPQPPASDRSAKVAWKPLTIINSTLFISLDGQQIPISVGERLPDGSSVVTIDAPTSTVTTTRSTFRVE
jgi:hypothetical protein